ncbi:hypothetical protein Ancab_018707 [Ancistrocladus abbreviatus]
MADADAFTSKFSAEEVGNAFVSQFYHILHESPEMVYRFYQDSSTVSRPGSDGCLVTATTMKGINDLIVSLNCKDYKAEIMTADAQTSYVDGVIVLVTGCLTGTDNVRRKFTESFFLAPQEKGYFVLNDAFRFVDDDILPANKSFEVKVFDEDASAAPLSLDPETTEVLCSSPPHHAAAEESIIDNNVEACDESRGEEGLTVREAVVPQADSSHNNAKPVAKNNKDGTGTMVNVSNTAPRTAPSNAVQQSHGARAYTGGQQSRGTATSVAGEPQQSQAVAASASAPESSAPNASDGHGSNVDPTEDKGFSVYIGNLPLDATVGQVEQEFKKFGPIKLGGVQVRGNQGFCFGFVEFESQDSMKAAIEMRQIRIGGQNAYIEEKKTTTRVVNGVRSFPSGRSGRNDYVRRGDYNNYPSGRGGYGNYGRRGDFSNGAGNGDGYKKVYPNGGSRRGRQGDTI